MKILQHADFWRRMDRATAHIHWWPEWLKGSRENRRPCPHADGFTWHTAHHIETHGLDCGPFEHWDEEWYECDACGAEFTERELDEMAEASDLDD